MDKEIFLKEVGSKIVKLRLARGWSQAELARRCFKDPQSIERVENGKVNPSIYFIKQVAEGLEVNIKELFV